MGKILFGLLLEFPDNTDTFLALCSTSTISSEISEMIKRFLDFLT